MGKVAGAMRALALGGCGWLAASALSPAYAQPVVQPLPGPEAQRLSEALRALGQDPQSLSALIAAGEASLALQDVDAANGFFRRAEAVSPGDGRIKAGLAAALVQRRQPAEALRLFAEAEQVGALPVNYIAERGLAYDLVGDNARAQRDYTVALSVKSDPVIVRRLALSQAIAGDQRAAEASLLPLLQQQDLAAYRTRAFALAIAGKADEAVSIARTMLPDRLSSGIAPYLRYMPQLTRAQQAAAANLGVFPAPGEIGRDHSAIAAHAAGGPQPSRTADARLIPSGRPLGSTPAEPQVALAQPASQVPAAASIPAPARPPAPAPAPVVAAATPVPQPVAEPPVAPAPAAAQPALVLASASAEPATPITNTATLSAPATPVASLSPQQPVTPSAAPRPSLTDAFAELGRPAGIVVPPAQGAVDITAIQPRRPQVAAAPKPEPAKPAAAPKPPPVPSRHWVQVATGRDTKALAFDWRRIKKEADGLLDKHSANTASWVQTNRLLAGPFPTASAADQMIGKLKEKKVDSFRFTSAAGEEVKPLD